VLVTGGNRGLGVGIVEALAQANAKVAMIYNSAKDAHDVAKRLSEKWGTEIKAYQANVGESDKIRAVFTQVEQEMGPIHGVVANSGISVVKPALELNADDFKKVFDVNVLGVFNTAQAAADLWIKRKQPGSIVVISSMSDTIVNSPIQQVFYNSSKGAVSNLTRCLAAEWAPNQIRVNNVCPGFIETDQARKLTSPAKQTMHMDPELRKNQSAEVPLGRFSKPWEQAGQVVYFLSKYSSCKSSPSRACIRAKRARTDDHGRCSRFACEQTRPVRALTSTA
ncbi:NADP-dependent mannitol dehydrogenase, partial [Rhodotorula sp. JG-1b]